MIRRPPRSTLFPYTRSSDLERVGARGCSGLELVDGDLELLLGALELRFGDAHQLFVGERRVEEDRKSTRLNSSHLVISYAVFCLKKKKMHLHYASSTNDTTT